MRAQRRLPTKLSCCTSTLWLLKAYRDVNQVVLTSLSWHNPSLSALMQNLRNAAASNVSCRLFNSFQKKGDKSNVKHVHVCESVFYTSDVGLDVGVCVRERGGQRRPGVWFSGWVWLLREQLLIGSLPLLELSRRQLGIGQQPVNQR